MGDGADNSGAYHKRINSCPLDYMDCTHRAENSGDYLLESQGVLFSAMIKDCSRL